MKVKYARRNANGLPLNERSLSLLHYNYDQHGDFIDDHYGRSFIKIGDEYTVYALTIRNDLAYYYIMEPVANTITHFPAICFDVVDDRITKYWHMKRYSAPARDAITPLDAYEVTYFAIKEWIQEPRFLGYLVDDKERELGIMNKMIKLMDEEFKE